MRAESRSVCSILHLRRKKLNRFFVYVPRRLSFLPFIILCGPVLLRSFASSQTCPGAMRETLFSLREEGESFYSTQLCGETLERKSAARAAVVRVAAPFMQWEYRPLSSHAMLCACTSIPLIAYRVRHALNARSI